MQNVQQSSQPSSSILDLWENPTIRLVGSIVGLVGLIAIVAASVGILGQDDVPRLVKAVLALAIGIFGIWLFFFFVDSLVSNLPDRAAAIFRPYVFVGPALFILGTYLVYPTIFTVILSFQNRNSTRFVGLDNYIRALTDQDFLLIFRNNILWLVLVTFFAVSLGLLIAVLADRVKAESLVKSLIFMPMAISFVGASVIWRFIYYFQPAGREQIGLLNAIWTSLGGEPIAWLTKRSIDIPIITDIFAAINLNVGLPLNSLLLIIIMIWLQTGFAMVIISAAIKGVPGELLEAARIDGASEVAIFFRVTIPYIRGTILTVATTILIGVLKVFDIVFVMTSGNSDTQVIANEMYSQMFRRGDFGMGSALAVILLLAVIPFIINNIRSWQEEREQR